MKKHIVFLAISLAAFVNGQAQSKEQVYAGIILHIMKYVEWPGHANDAMTVGVVNDLQLTTALNKAAAGKKIHFKDVRVIKYKGVSSLAGCNILFFPKKSVPMITEVQSAAMENHILVITEEKGTAVSGAGINFVESQGKLRFELYSAVIRKADLRVSEQLSKYAIVKG